MIEIETTVKGGLPVLVRADYYSGGYTIHWPNGREITNKVWNSIPDDDHKEIEYLVGCRYDTYLQDERDARGDYEYEQRRDRYL